MGKAIDDTHAEVAGKAALSDVKPLSHNGYMVQIAKTLVKRVILSCK
jgi:CO/xanthine dehydrogenase FAD-binding subunit